MLLCSTLHDPRGVFLDVLSTTSEIVLRNYRGWVVNLTATTEPKIKHLLQEISGEGVYVYETDTVHPIVEDKIENDHLNLLTKTVFTGEELGLKKIQYTDGDRIITAATHFPDDLQTMALKASELTGESLSYLNFRRSPEDFFAHHLPLIYTECEFNRLYTQAFGIPIDIGSTSHVMSFDVLEEIICRSPSMECVSFPHPKWLIIAKEMGAKIQSEETENVLTFETPDQFREEVIERINNSALILDSYDRLQKLYMVTLGLDSIFSESEWRLRFNTQRQYINLLKNHLPMFGFNQPNENSLINEINSTLVSMGIKQQAIAETLHQVQYPN